MRRWLSVHIALAALAATCAVHQDAAAQAPDARGAARQAYIEGTRAVEEERWADAVVSFREAYRHGRNPAALFNGAVALRALGRYVEARDAFIRLLEDHPTIGDELAGRARALLDETRSRIGTVVVQGPVDCALVLDDVDVGVTAAEPREIDVDAGQHRLHAACEGRDDFTWSERVGAGERVRVVIVAPETPEPLGDPNASGVAQADAGIDDGGPGAAPWVVLSIGAATAIAGAVLLGIAISDTSTVENVAVGTPFSEVESAYDRAVVLSWLGPLMIGVGAAAAVVGLWWGLSSGSGAESSVEVGAGPSGIRIRGVF